MAADILLAAGSAAGVLGILVLRASWGRSSRSSLRNLAGWVCLALAVIGGAGAAGAWGIAVVSLWAMTAAFACLGWAAVATPPRAARLSNRRAGMMAKGIEPLRLGGRLLTFALVAILSFASAISLALLVRWISTHAGAGQANATVLALFAAPLAWTLLAYAILMSRSRRRQFALIGVTMTAALPPIMAGALA